jgi:hypothetical protein
MRDVLLRFGMDADRAARCATLFADASRDGFPSHGLNRFGRFVTMIRNGMVDVNAHPVRIAAAGALERWDGRRGPGNLNAHACMTRAIELRARGKRLPGWGIDENGLCAVLPQSPVASTEPVEPLRLIPMGAARLRISAFPVIAE